MKPDQELIDRSVIYHSPAEFRAAVIERHRRHVNSGLARLADLMGTPLEIRSSGNYVFDEQGKKYLDCGGYGVFTLGHCHPTIVDAVKQQLDRNPLSTRSLLNPEVGIAAEALARVTPEGLNYVYFGGSGAEATEAALKLACLNGKTKLIAMHDGYHGKTIGALSVTGGESYRAPFQALLPKVEFVRFGDPDELEAALLRHVSASCVILEPVQAEGGVNIPPQGYLSQVEKLCRDYGAFFILDEIQTGLGRLGAWWGADREKVIPDVLLVGKALSGGVVPVSAVVAPAWCYDKLNRDPFLHTSTFSGNPLAAAAATAAIDVIQREGVVPLAQRLGERLLTMIKQLSGTHYYHLIRETRGEGLLIGIEFKSEFLAGDFMTEMTKRNVIVSYSLNAHCVVRLTPSAFLTDSDVSWLETAFVDSMNALNDRYQSSCPR